MPSGLEIAACRPHLERELELVRPKLILPVGRLAIEQFLSPAPLVDIIGRVHHTTVGGQRYAVLPLPHPSGASTWYRTPPGDGLTRQALDLLGRQAAWKRLRAHSS